MKVMPNYCRNEEAERRLEEEMERSYTVEELLRMMSELPGLYATGRQNALSVFA